MSAWYSGRQVFVTGHTGFKGAWLCEWLLALGAEVTGYSLAAPTQPALSDQLGLATRVHHVPGDIQDLDRLSAAVAAARPDYVFHLAAQSLVRDSYARPIETFSVNVLGTAHLLEALRRLDRPCAAVIVTSDKCYENRDWVYGYREDDPLGGHDPYSASKGAAELVVSSMRRSFFARSPVRIASARAGNVIGGGDWARDRILPDCMRALAAGQPIAVRNPSATRPWQHVLEPLSGYLWLGALLARPEMRNVPLAALTSGFNFGPDRDANRTVRELVECVLERWPGSWVDGSEANAPAEARLLQLATDKAHGLLGWAPVWRFQEAVAHTVAWYRALATAGGDVEVRSLTLEQIQAYTRRAGELGAPWAG